MLLVIIDDVQLAVFLKMAFFKVNKDAKSKAYVIKKL